VYVHILQAMFIFVNMFIKPMLKRYRVKNDVCTSSHYYTPKN
jgi:hypothetical protein